MKIREIRVRNFRNFRDLTRLSFKDEVTGLVRPISIMVGSNGSGKTTLFSLLEGLLSFAIEVVESAPITNEVREKGYAALHVQIDDDGPAAAARDFWVALGRKDQAPPDAYDLPNQICHLEQRGGSGKPLIRNKPTAALNKWVREMLRKEKPLQGGLLHFPHNRWVEHEQRGAIEPPATSPTWLWRFEAGSAWHGSLAQLWVWQNYLDLETGREGRPNLAPFVEIVEQILGGNRKITIREGHVRVTSPGGTTVEPHQLPSGEQQILTLFGELARRLRPGAVILIDEVEISLHPALQRAVLYHLRNLARDYKLQIILTTHSLELVRSAEPGEIINLDNMALAEAQAKLQATA